MQIHQFIPESIMKAAVLRSSEDLIVVDVPVPECEQGQVLVKVSDCGLCGSDIRYYHGDNPWAKETLGVYVPPPSNIILGHEVAGTVVDSQNTAGPLAGKRVAVLSFAVDHTCFWCRHGMEHLCPNTLHLGHSAGWGERSYYYGGMAEYVPVWSDHCYEIPENVSNEAAALLDPLCVAIHGVNRARIRPGDTLLITGGGTIGAFSVAVAKVFGAGTIIQTDIDDRILETGRKMGADVSVNVSKTDLKEVVMDITSGLGVIAILDTVGRPLSDLLPLLARGGNLVTYAVQEAQEPFSTMALSGERSVASTANFELRDFQTGIDLLASRRIDAEAVITHRFSLEEALQAFATADNKAESGAVKVMLKISA